jgi:CubicO group peptidase (beta-lactamase class C family)
MPISMSLAPGDPEVANTSHPSQGTSIHEVGAYTIYAIASCTKILVNVAYHKLISRGNTKARAFLGTNLPVTSSMRFARQEERHLYAGVQEIQAFWNYYCTAMALLS